MELLTELKYMSYSYKKDPRQMTFDELIQQAVNTCCEKFSISETELKSKSRKKHIAVPRMACMYVLRKHGLPYPFIGRIFNRDHSTVIHGCKTITDILSMPFDLWHVQIKNYLNQNL